MSFIDQYYINPIISGEGYNIVNTLTYAVILIALVFLTYRLIKRMSVRIDSSFFSAVLPFVFLGGLLRAIEDLQESSQDIPSLPGIVLTSPTGVERNILFITPIIYITIFVISLAALVISLLIARKFAKNIGYAKIWFAIGAVIDIALIAAFVRVAVIDALLYMLIIFLVWLAALLAVWKWRSRKTGAGSESPSEKPSFFSSQNLFVLLVHMFDATTTFVALSFFPYFEQHVLPGFLISIAGPAVMFPLKLAVVSAVLWAFDRDIRSGESRTFLKLVVLILGMGPGLRNFFRLIMGV